VFSRITPFERKSAPSNPALLAAIQSATVTEPLAGACGPAASRTNLNEHGLPNEPRKLLKTKQRGFLQSGTTRPRGHLRQSAILKLRKEPKPPRHIIIDAMFQAQDPVIVSQPA
jgi:hypothetical protein